MEQISGAHFLRNAPVTRPSLVASNKIFGPDLNLIKGKTVLLKTLEVRITIANVPISIMSHHSNVTLAAYILYVKNITFLVSISVSIKFIILKRIINHKAKTIDTAFTRIKKEYLPRVFTLSVAKVDNEFEPLCAGLAKQRILIN